MAAAPRPREQSRSACAAARTWSGDTGRSSARGAGSRSAAARARRATAGRTARNLARVSERYTETAIHFDVERLPAAARALAAGRAARARRPRLRRRAALRRARADGTDRRDSSRYTRSISRPARLARVSARFPWIVTSSRRPTRCPGSPTDRSTPSSRRWSWSTSRTSGAYLAEIRRVLRPAAART